MTKKTKPVQQSQKTETVPNVDPLMEFATMLIKQPLENLWPLPQGISKYKEAIISNVLWSPPFGAEEVICPPSESGLSETYCNKDMDTMGILLSGDAKFTMEEEVFNTTVRVRPGQECKVAVGKEGARILVISCRINS